jgi:tRNA A37 methylthiotransferase MiaB
MSVGPTVYLETFGCQMNELDSELVRGHLRSLGYRFTENFQTADVVLYNTCAVRAQSEQKVLSRLGVMQQRKKEQPDLVVGMLGCMAERTGADLAKKLKHLDVVVDLRVGSPTFGRHEAMRLDDVDRRAVYVAEGLGHGFVALSDAGFAEFRFVEKEAACPAPDS